MKFYDCPNPKVTNMTISIKSVNTDIGVISIEGSFLPKTEQVFGFPPENPLLNAEVIIQKDEIIYQKNQEFTYYAVY